MSRYVVTTWENVKGTYIVDAESPEAARVKFSSNKTLHAALDDGTVEQEDYDAFQIEFNECELVQYGQSS